MPERNVVKLPIRVRNVVAGDESTVAAVVHCPSQGRSIDVARCTSCGRVETMAWDAAADGGHVTCDAGDARAAGWRTDPRIDFTEAAARYQLHELVDAVTVCGRPNMLVSDARAIFAERDLRAMPVVDEDLRLVGLLSRSDLVRELPADATVGDVMATRVHALPERAPIGYAIALMAMEDVSEVPVVTEDGEIVGMLHALDALRWTAARMGYVLDRSATTR